MPIEMEVNRVIQWSRGHGDGWLSVGPEGHIPTRQFADSAHPREGVGFYTFSQSL